MSHPTPTEITVESSLDHTPQPSRGIRVDGDDARPLLVLLHTWSGDYHQDASPAIRQAVARQWHFIQPNFRGPNHTPQACGSKLARQDIIDAVDWACENWPVDADRIYVLGGSGGGHMAMNMAAHFPDRFAAVSAWCGISNIATWHRQHNKDGKRGRYAQDIEASVNGAPGDSDEIDQDLYDRSPVHHIAAAVDLPLDLSHGVLDGKTGSVHFHHSIDAYNVLAEAQGEPTVTLEEVRQLDESGMLESPTTEDKEPDPLYGDKAIHLRRAAGKTRITIFQGGHEILVAAGCGWLARHALGKTPELVSDESIALLSGSTDIDK